MQRLCCALLLLATACASQGEGQWREGGLYASRQDDGTYAIVKILKLDESGVHVRVYSNRFDTIPETLDENELYMAGVDHGSDEQLGLGHLPLSRTSFVAWQARFIKVVDVTESELEGYRVWLDANGGYF